MVDVPGSGLQAFPVDAGSVAADDARVSARQAWLTTTFAVGGVSLVIAVVVSIVAPRGVTVGGSLAWIGFAVLPLYLVAVWLCRQRPDHPQAWRLLLVTTAGAVGVAIEVLVRLAFAELSWISWLWWANLLYQLTAVLSEIGAAQVFATYPDGVVEKPWQAKIVRLTWWWLVLPPLLLLVSPTIPVDQYLINPAPTVPNPVAVPGLAALAPAVSTIYGSHLAGLLAMVVLLARYRESEREQRRRMRLLVAVVAFGVVVLVASLLLGVLGAPSGVIRAVQSLFIVVLFMVAVSIVVGVMRYRLYDIDLIVRRSVVYGGLSAGIAAIYIGLAALPGLALSDQIPVQLAVVLTIVAALAFQPLRRRLENVADRWVFGKRVNRYQVLTEFGAELEATVGLGDLLPRLAAAVKEGLGAPWVRVSLPGAGSTAGEPAGPVGLTVPLERAGDRPGVSWTVQGTIECGAKPGGYEPVDTELLTTLAGQASTAIANVRLTAELAARLAELEKSRARIVAAQDAERRRIERNIHDGVQQEVVALMMKLRLARNQIGRGERTAEDALAELQVDVRELLVDLRELAHGIHPPVLSDGGLVAAVEARTARLPFDVRITVPSDLRGRRFAEDVEGAAYFVVCEALTNAVKHSGATGTEVELTTTPGRLSVLVRDDGAGFAQADLPGTGLTNLRDRVEALGGRFRVETEPGKGTTVIADLPVATNGAHHG
jgi:signal transduction histidine kinase